MNNQPNILFTSTFSTPFIHTDIHILKKEFTVTVLLQSGLSALLRYVFLVPACTHTYTWFASTYASAVVFLASMFRKKSVLVLGGVDVARMPEFRYGIWNSRWRSALVRYAIRNANQVIAVDASLKRDAMSLAAYDGKNIAVLPTGYDDSRWFPAGGKEHFVLTVAHCPDENKARIKGIDFLADIARHHTHMQFVVIGIPEAVRRRIRFPENVTVIEYTEQEKLLSYYQRAKVYLQPSRREGLPNTLCEAMLCECFPVGTDTGGIPSAIDDAGIIISHGDITGAIDAIMQGMSAERSTAARARIQQHYSLQSREQKLHDLIRTV